MLVQKRKPEFNNQCLKSEAVYFMDGQFVVIFDTCKQWHSSLILKSVIKPMDLLYFASILFEFEISCLCESFLNLMQTW